jgi:hypothetical protein
LSFVEMNDFSKIVYSNTFKINGILNRSSSYLYGR